ncbi:MAG: beta strand repeat-containing protein, partial [Brevundimonas sp.]
MHTSTRCISLKSLTATFLAIASFWLVSLIAPQASAQTQTGYVQCVDRGTPYWQGCVDDVTWTADPGQTVSGTLVHRGATAQNLQFQKSADVGTFSFSGTPNQNWEGATSNVTYSWSIPAGTPAGQYRARVFAENPEDWDNIYHTPDGSFRFSATTTNGYITVNVRSVVPPAPTVSAASGTTPYQTAVNIDVPVSGTWTSVQAVANPSNGTVSFSGRQATYRPANGFIGNDSFTVRATGPGGNSNVATVTVRVNAPAAPTVANVSASTGHNQAVTFASATGGLATSLNVGTSGQGTPGVSGMNLTFTPTNGFYGNATFLYSANGPGGRSADATATVTVAPPPAPTAAGQTQPVGYEASAAFNLSVGGDWSSVAIVAQPGKGGVSLAGARATYTAGAGSLGSDTFTWRATGPGGNSATATVTMNIANPAAPGASDVSANALYETAKNIALAPSGVYNSVAVVAQPANGAVTISGTTARYTPAAGFFGTDTFTYRATGPGGNSPTRTVTVTVAPPAAPVAVNLTASTPYQTNVSFSAPGHIGVVQVETTDGAKGAAMGSPTVDGAQFLYMPAANEVGTDTFTYRLRNAGGWSNVATVTVTIGAPPAPGAGNVTASTAYETAVAVALTPSGVWSSIEKMSDPANGTVTISGTTATYTPAAGFYGTNTFSYRATGLGGNSPTRTVTVTVAVPPPPTAADTTLATAYQTAGARVLPVAGVLTSVSVVAQPTNGSVSITGTTATYTPSAGFVGADAFTYRATGPGGSSPTRTVAVTVNAPPRPVANNLTATTAYETPVAVRILGASSGAITGSGYVVSQPANGQATQGGPNITYRPNAGFFGTDTFTWGISGPGGASTPATVTVTVGLPDVPGAANITASTPYETAADIALQPSGVWSSLAVVAQPTNGSVSITGTTARFTPSAGFFGTATWTYRAMGVGGNSDPATVTVTVGLPSAPGAANVSSSTIYETAVTIPLAPSGVWTAIQKMSDPANGSVSITGDTATYTPAAGFYGTNTFSYRATGPGGNSPTRTVTVTVAVPPAPTAANTTLSAGFQTAGTRVLPVSGVLTSVSVVDQPANGSVSITGTTLTYTPAAGYHGADSLTYQATGPGGSSQVRTVTITVATPGAPTVQNANLSTPYETAGSVSLTTSGFAPVLSITEQPIHGSAALSGLNVTYTPAAGYYGADTFKVVATNAGGTSAAATVSVTVGNPPAPGLANASLTTAFETTGGVDLSPSGVWSSLEVVSQGTNGTASISGSRLTYEPAAGFYGA